MFLLTGCIGEEYDFSPPTVSLSNHTLTQTEELAEANIDWESDKQYYKKTEDIVTLANKQDKIYAQPGETVDLLFDNGDFDLKRATVSVWQNDKKIDLDFKKDQTVDLPIEIGQYMLVVDLSTDSGTAQYVGNILITE